MMRRVTLAEIDGWFSAGFALPELTEAQALLEQLGRIYTAPTVAATTLSIRPFANNAAAEWIWSVSPAECGRGRRAILQKVRSQP